MKVHCMRLGRGLFITIYVGVTTPHAFLQTAGGWADVNVSFCFEGLSNRLTETIELTYRKHMHALLFIEGVNGRNMQKPHLISASDLDLVAISDSPHSFSFFLASDSRPFPSSNGSRILAQTSKKKENKHPNAHTLTTDDPQQHVVEVQLVHRNLFNVRNQVRRLWVGRVIVDGLTRGN